MSQNDEINSVLIKVEKYLSHQSEMYGKIVFQQNEADVANIESIDDSEITSDESQEVSKPAIKATEINQIETNNSNLMPDQSEETKALESISTLDELEAYCKTLELLKTDLPDTNLVFGKGNPIADLMIIGEAPGAEEDKLGEPFVGRSGQLLTKILQAIQFERDQVFIANILKHRPPDNRNPTSAERDRSLPYLLKQIEIINPKIILCLGKVSAETLLKTKSTMKEMRGVFHNFGNKYELLVTYHPAALLRNPNWKRDTWEDVQLLRKRYDELGCKP
jgi:uracil-DNA glycosylase